MKDVSLTDCILALVSVQDVPLANCALALTLLSDVYLAALDCCATQCSSC